ncbi:MAG: DUF6051 family protein [Deltaproteobacteria bacterium]|jgi:hypothetical protein|nr:DUF6051 family protein [Deltaproteobacteria bacterium]
MLYHQLHECLRSRFSLAPDLILLPETDQVVRVLPFESDTSELPDIPAGGGLHPREGESDDDAADRALSDSVALVRDAEIAQNGSFRLPVIAPAASLAGGARDARGVLVLLHGLNERGWEKYLPWASELCRGTGKPVVLFPIAFHVNRSPASWNDTRLMRRVSRARKLAFPDLLNSSVSNAAISARLTADPSRFLWAGLETLRDLRVLAFRIRGGRLPGIAADAAIDLFTYSIGTLLAEILLCADEGGLFADSRAVAFCGGPVLDRLYPSSKFILDSEAAIRLRSFFLEHLESRLRADPRLRARLAGEHGEEGRWCRAFLDSRLDMPLREGRLRQLAPRLYAVPLAGDEVVPPYEVLNTLLGARRDIPVPVDFLETGYPCRHEDPFPPAAGRHAEAVDACFRKVFARFCEFLG